MQITDIIKDFSTLSTAELEEVIRSTRRSRTTAKPVTVSKRPTKEKAAGADSLKKQLSGLTPAQLEIMKKLLS